MAEYTARADSSLAHSEVAFYLLDAVPMLLFCLTFIIVWSPKVFEEYYPANSVDLSRRNAEPKLEAGRPRP